jgi:hypothetical protein
MTGGEIKMSGSITGGCLCGAVRYECAAEPVAAGHCHCEDCRRTSGTGHGSHMAVPAAAFALSGEVKTFDKPADSGNVVGRAFCPTCGGAVYSVNSGNKDLVFLRASSLNDLEVFKPQLVVYAAKAASWDLVDPSLPAFEEMPPKEERPIDI